MYFFVLIKQNRKKKPCPVDLVSYHFPIGFSESEILETQKASLQ